MLKGGGDEEKIVIPNGDGVKEREMSYIPVRFIIAILLIIKVYISDDKYAIVGTINLDYRSLVHHFENGIWLYQHEVLEPIKADMEATMSQSIEVTDGFIKETLVQKIIRVVVRTVAPLL